MGFRFFRRMKIAPGVSLNLSKSGGSFSLGPRGAKLTLGSRGGRATVGLPGTGLFYTTTLGTGRSKRQPSTRPSVPAVRPQDRLTLSFFQRWFIPNDEKAFVDGCRELALGDEEKAYEYLCQAVHLPDGAFLAGFLSLKKGLYDTAIEYLTIEPRRETELGRYFSKYGISGTINLPITEEVSANVGPDVRGVLLGLAEAYQRLERLPEAITCLRRLNRLEPDDVVVKLSLAEALSDTKADGDVSAFQEVIRLGEGIENESPFHAALLLYKARALRGLGLLDAARELLSALLRRKKDRADEFLRAVRYERVLVYEELGERRLARVELEKLYAEAPDYQDVAERLGIAR